MIIFKGDYIKTKNEKDFSQVVYVYINSREAGSPEYIVLSNGRSIKMTCYNINPNNIIEEIKTCKQVTGYDFEEYQERNKEYFANTINAIKEQLNDNSIIHY
tara:strand:- start:363 stop:668 length:306 start_codon:yes stop_codon:yes gene_type:complete